MPTAFITGASSGLGRGLALHYAKRGWTVHAAARRKDRLAELEREGGPGRIVPVELDVGDLSALAAAVRAAEPLDLAVANAGIGRAMPAAKIDWEWVQRILHVNATAACVTLAAAAPAMAARGSGRLVGISSLAAFRGLPANAAYCASKAALHTFLDSLRVDLRGSGVRVTGVYPGFVKTELTAKNKFRMPFLMELDEAVKVMARAIDRGAARVSFPLPLAAGTMLMAALPRLVYEPLAARVGRRTF